MKDFVPALRFVAVSDIHVNENEPRKLERFKKMAKIVNRIADNSPDYKKLDALYIVGDFADNGAECQMVALKEAIDEEFKPETEVTITLASHEYSQKNGGEEAALERFSRIFGMDYDTHKVIGGFHFIAVTTTRGCHFGDEKKEWLAKELKIAAEDDPKKPIFVFQHPHITDTVYGSINWGEDELTAILMDYPQVVDFSGHSHAPINDPRSIHQKYFTSLGTGSLAYFELDEFDKIYGTVPPKCSYCAQMLIVEASADNQVRVYPYDVLTDNYFPFVWEIDTPWDPTSFKYTDARYKTTEAPYFAPETYICLDDVTENSAVLEFAQAKADKEYVNSYEIILKETATGLIKKQFSIWSEYYFYNMPELLSYEIKDLSPQTEYTVEIYATSFWKTKSEKPLVKKFTTR